MYPTSTGPSLLRRVAAGSSVLLGWLVLCAPSHAEPSINANLFTHFEAYHSSEATNMDDVRWGESALFVTGRLTDRLSFLSEISFEIPKYRDRSIRMERLRLRYDLNRDNWLIFGKVHTPVNYWNDMFHHGRLFFPTINRPLSFNRFIPIHEAGLRAAGSNLFGTSIGYDIVLGTGQSTGDDVFEEGIQSYTYTLSWSPDTDFKVMASYYRDTILDHTNNPYHNHNHGGDMGPVMPQASMMTAGDGHSMDPMDSMHSMHAMDGAGKGDLSYELMSYSMYWRGEHFTALTELSMNRTDGGSFNEAAFQYVGYHYNEDLTLYALFDLVNVNANEIHFAPGREARYGVGVEYAFGLASTVKVELRRRDDHTDFMDQYSNEVQVQLSFGF